MGTTKLCSSLQEFILNFHLAVFFKLSLHYVFGKPVLNQKYCVVHSLIFKTHSIQTRSIKTRTTRERGLSQQQDTTLDFK